MPVRCLFAVVGLGLLLGGPVRAQSDEDVSIAATAKPSTVGTAGTVTFEIEVRGAPLSVIQAPEPPSTTNFVLQEATPVTRRELSFDSGHLTRRITFAWRYTPMRVGIGRIQPATLRVRGERYRTDEIRVRIVPQSQRPQTVPRGHARPQSPTDSSPEARSSGLGPRSLFIRATATADTVYQNEQVTAEYRLFFRPGVRLRQSRMVDAWDAPGFWREELDVASRPTPRTTTLRGTTYKNIVLKRVALFPTRAGRLSVDPLRIETEARTQPRLGRRDEAPTRDRYEPMTLASEELIVAARPLPSGAPPAFDGAVGQFRLDTQISADSVQVGEAVELTARLQGTGNIATVSPPVLDPPSDLETYDPTVDTDVNRSGTVVQGTKTFTYALVPRSNGSFTLPPVRFAYFDPEAEQYRTLRSEPAALRVTGDVPPRAESRTGEGLPIGDIAGPIDDDPRWVRVDRPPLYARPWVYAAVAGPLLLALGAMAVRRRRREPDASDADDGAALDAAHEPLRAARRSLQDEEVRAFYEAIERAVLAVLDQRLDLPRPANRLSADALVRHLAHHDVAEPEQTALRELLTTCHQAQFTPSEPSPDAMEAALEHTQTLLHRLDEALPAEA